MQGTSIPSGFAAAPFSMLVVLMILVVIQNTQSVPATVLFHPFSIPLALLLALTLVSGVLSGVVICHSLSEGKHRRYGCPRTRLSRR